MSTEQDWSFSSGERRYLLARVMLKSDGQPNPYNDCAHNVVSWKKHSEQTWITWLVLDPPAQMDRTLLTMLAPCTDKNCGQREAQEHQPCHNAPQAFPFSLTRESAQEGLGSVAESRVPSKGCISRKVDVRMKPSALC